VTLLWFPVLHRQPQDGLGSPLPTSEDREDVDGLRRDWLPVSRLLPVLLIHARENEPGRLLRDHGLLRATPRL